MVVIAGTGDTASAGIGAGAARDFEGHLYIGTSSWLSCHVPFKRTDILSNITSLPSGIPGRYWVATEQDTAGKCLTWLIDNLLYPDDDLSVGAATRRRVRAHRAGGWRRPSRAAATSSSCRGSTASARRSTTTTCAGVGSMPR